MKKNMTSSLSALSPLDGRYLEKTKNLRQYFSESALIKHRILVEVKYVIALVEFLGVEKVSKREKGRLEKWVEGLTEKDLLQVKKIENQIKHDVKAVEVFVRRGLRGVKGKGGRINNWVHWGLTSEDVNNLAQGLMIKDALSKVIIPAQKQLVKQLLDLAKKHKKVIMPARTHGQIAVPTTVGKELIVFASRATFFIEKITKLKLSGKLNGAVGNYNAQTHIFPRKNWIKFSQDFVRSLGLEPTLVTTQIEPSSRLVYLLDLLRQLNNIWLDLARDCWMYIALDYFVQKTVKVEVGSSTMPYKVNPINFENAEGNLELANTLLTMLSNKLPISRLQRDLSDSTVKRNIGVALGYGMIGIDSLQVGLNKIEPNREYLIQQVRKHPEMLTEALQLQLRAWGKDRAYDQIKKATRGKKVDWEELINELRLSKKQKEKLSKWKVEEYVGMAEELVDTAMRNVRSKI